ncbi:MAG: hypothetical protein AAFN10_18895, partial [Bacteroidota bacterium]
GNDQPVNAVVFSPDAKSIITGGDNEKILLWDRENNTEPIRTFAGHSSYISSLAFSPDGKQILASGEELILWDTESGEQIMTFEGPTGYDGTVSFSPNGKQILWGGDGKVFLYNIDNKTPIQSIENDLSKLLYLSFSPDGKQAIIGGRDLRVWDLGTNKLFRTYQQKERYISALAYTPDGQTIITGGDGGELLLWDNSMDFPAHIYKLDSTERAHYGIEIDY